MRWLIAPFLALAGLIGLATPVRAADPEIWFIPIGRADWQNLLLPGAPWQSAVKRVNVLGFASWWLNAGTDAQILAIFDFAKKHNMKIEMETSMIAHYSTEACGHMEGYSTKAEITRQIAVLTRLNLHVDILTMDEPLWFGHYDKESNACQLSIPDMVDRIMENYKIIAAQNPNLRIVQIEPIPAITNFPDWNAKLDNFQNLFNRATGRRIESLQLDVGWDRTSWMQPMRDILRYTRQHNIGLGFYVYGGSSPSSDAQWIAQAMAHADTAEGTLGIIPGQAIFTSWSKYPTNTLPETSPTTLTWLINRYFRQRTMIQAQFTGTGIRGKLTSTDGKPIANATIGGYVPGVDWKLPLPTEVVRSVVPAKAAFAVIGFRLNAECNCAGMNDVLVGLLQYQETQGGSLQYAWTMPFNPRRNNNVLIDSEWVGGVQVTRAIATPTQVLGANSPFYPVTPGASMTFTVPASTIGGDGWYGHAVLLWFDKDKNGLPGPLVVIPEPGHRLMSSTTTAADGSFALTKLPRVGPGAAPVTVEYAGSDVYRAVGWTPLPK